MYFGADDKRGCQSFLQLNHNIPVVTLCLAILMATYQWACKLHSHFDMEN